MLIKERLKNSVYSDNIKINYDIYNYCWLIYSLREQRSGHRLKLLFT